MDKTIIIGSGLGGLLAGLLLCKEGMNVTVLEKHRKFGGCLQTFQRGMYSFDTGMHYIGSLEPGQPLFNYWRYFGLTDKLNLMKLDKNGYDRISFSENSSSGSVMDFPLSQGFDNFREQLLPFFPNGDSVLRTYIRNLDEITHAHPLYNLELPAIQAEYRFHSLTASSYLSQLLTGIRHPASGISLFNILAGNNFLYAGNPSTTPLSQFGLINHSFISSAWRIAGGSQKIADILAEGIRSHGGDVLLKKEVVSIRRNREGFQIETSDGDHLESSRVISGIHPATTMALLDEITIPKTTGKRIQTLKNTISVFSVYLGLKPDTFPFLNYNVYHHTSSDIWTDKRPGIHDIRNASKIENRRSQIADPCWPSQFLFMTPPEKDQGPYAHTAVIMSPMDFDEVMQWEESASGDRNKSYFVFKAKRSKQLLDLVYQKFPALKGAIATIDISTPLTWRDYTGTPEGAMYGIRKDAGNPERTTLLPKTKIPGLFFTGQNVNLHGALGVTIGTVTTCGEILGLSYVLNAIKG